jgi:hypothetical protein
MKQGFATFLLAGGATFVLLIVFISLVNSLGTPPPFSQSSIIALSAGAGISTGLVNGVAAWWLLR